MNDRQNINEEAVDARTTRGEIPGQTPLSGTVETAGTAGADEGFLPSEQMNDLRGRWSDVQASFVDDPRTAVKQAHDLVTDVLDRLTETFTRERSGLESQWNGGGDADTEALRVALQRYRSFFNRLLGS